MKINKVASALALVGGLLCGTAQASLVDRGGGMLYDDVLNVTWLQDANYAKTSGYDSDGKMNWNAAYSWAANLSYGGFNDWRLPTVKPINGVSFNLFGNQYNGTSEWGFNITSTASEMAYMFYVNLGLIGSVSKLGIPLTNFGPLGNGWSDSGKQADLGLIQNLQLDWYWSNSEFLEWGNDGAWMFGNLVGSQLPNAKSFENFAWAVRDGDVAAAIPEPGSLALLGLALSCLVSSRRKRVTSNVKVAA